MNFTTQQRLQYFIDGVAKLESRQFTHLVMQKMPGFQMQCDRTGLRIERSGPHEEALEAFLLTFRLFEQKNDALSFSNLKKAVSATHEVSEPEAVDARQCVIDNYKQLMTRLRQPLQPGWGDQSLTYRAVLDVFLYGDYAHWNKREVAKGWRSNVFFPWLRWQFDLIVIDYLDTLILAKRCCQVLQAHLATTP